MDSVGQESGKDRRDGLSLLHVVCGFSWEDWNSQGWRIHFQDGFFIPLTGSWAKPLKAGLTGDVGQDTYMWPLHVAWASHHMADRSQEQGFQEQGFQENQKEAVQPFLT